MRAPTLRLGFDELIVDSFAGGGGASLGMKVGLGREPDIAINHDREAIAMHAANHLGTKHFCEDIWKVDPREACRGRRPGFAWFSPDCKHFSKAKGGKPVDKNIRGLAWIVVRWAKLVRPRVIALENVEEFEDWGPLGADNMPDRERRGLTFRIWKGKLEGLGYKVEVRQLVASKYGAATTRNRLYVIARCDGQPIVWPEEGDGLALTWRRIAADCIDWTLPSYSIFLTRKESKQYRIVRPLADNTMRRIARGLQKFVIDNPEPFIVPYWGGGKDRVHHLSEPLRTVMADPRYSLVTPYIAKFRGDSAGSAASAPVPTITAGPKENPAGAAHALGLVAPWFVSRYGERPGQLPRALSVDRPMPTIVPTQNGAQLVAAFLAKHYGDTGQRPGSAMREPVATITASDHNALVASSIVKFKGTSPHGQQLRLPLGTVQAEGNHYAQVNAFLVAYFGNEKDGGELTDPMRTVTARDRFGLVTVHGEPYVLADIGMRMLAPRELYNAQGFPDDYIIDLEIDGRRLPKDAQVRMVGNSVCPPVAAAIARAQFEDQVIEVAA